MANQPAPDDGWALKRAQGAPLEGKFQTPAFGTNDGTCLGAQIGTGTQSHRRPR